VTEKPVSITEFKGRDNAAEALRRAAVAAREACLDHMDAMRRAAQAGDPDAGYGVVEIVLLVVVVVLALVGIYYLAKTN
jgi:hypothetical protein